MENPPKIEAREATHPSEGGRTDGPSAGESDQRGDHHHVLLLVEDDADVRVAMQALLRLEGFKLLTAADGAEALDLLRRVAPPCLILLDFSMPGANGRDFRRQQMKDPLLAGIPTVLFSAHDGIAQRARELGITAFLPKPADFDALTLLVEQQCAGCTAATGSGRDAR